MVLAVSGATVAVSAAVTAVVSALVAAMVKWGGRIGAAIRAKVIADHQPLYQAGWALSRAEVEAASGWVSRKLRASRRASAVGRR
jgi:hypothetical protein